MRHIVLGSLAIMAGLHGCDSGYGDPTQSSVATPMFDGRYQLVAEESFRFMRDSLAAETDPERQALLRQIIADNEDAFLDFSIDHGVILCGRSPVQSFSLRTATNSDGELRGEAIWHEDIHDPGDVSVERLRLKLDGDRLEFRLGDEQAGFDLNLDVVVLRKLSE